MGQFRIVLLAIDNAHSTTEGPRLQTRLKWVKQDLWANHPTEFPIFLQIM